ncbi:hypothetical protein I3842_14G120400 [Carya illinoinensis]|uniref:Uncharacterized protein n=1 Tax=Carya illinoinensis TaxID=32201 RepID=A0A922DBB7_CARIL|nr:hypothetical protein I3842_14G120400 [Carya illinoinensis]
MGPHRYGGVILIRMTILQFVVLSTTAFHKRQSGFGCDFATIRCWAPCLRMLSIFTSF